ncbi:histidine phosphatase family protein [Nocardioides coralli]|uniref:histidine phosphatase family protein n=1 Tax=Nocardioides coralli TaxID=2872154 RepID=UPI001CA3EE98|nr:histidine phosphatase family protein [Nocardioides coralli]QZY30333.1 histidine phosphatase family protein [Nocardioides coralli]
MALPEPSQPTTLVLVRHGVTAHTTERRFSGGLAGHNPGLSEEGRAQVKETAEWLLPLAGQVGSMISSPVLRTRESADIVADVLGVPVVEDPAFAEMDFGVWEGMTFDEVAEHHRSELEEWLGQLDRVPGGGLGESFRSVEERVLGRLHPVLEEHEGNTLVVVSHVTPIKVMVAHAMGAPLEALFRMELAPASVTVLSFYPQPDRAPHPSLRMFNGVPPGRPAFLEPRPW